MFPSQVLTPVKKLRTLGYDMRLAVLTPIGQWVRGGSRRQLRELQDTAGETDGMPVAWLPSPPSRVRSTGIDRCVLAAWTASQVSRRSRFIMHCRGPRMTRIGLSLKSLFPNTNVVYDCRGVDHAELAYQGMPADEAAGVRQMEAETAQRADQVLCVSQAMARYVCATYGIPADKVAVVPCCVDTKRFTNPATSRGEMRRRLSLEDRLVIAYCGSIKAWQLPDQCLALFKRIKRAESSAHFLALTTQPESFRQLARRCGVADDHITFIRASHEDVPDYLAAADIGLLLREPSLVNEVAAPVKFAEYLASGNPVIISDGIGDYSDLTAKEEVGAVLSGFADDDASMENVFSFVSRYRKDEQRIRARCHEVARSCLDSDSHIGRVAALYDQIAGNGE